jgi:hypothetical protein
LCIRSSLTSRSSSRSCARSGSVNGASSFWCYFFQVVTQLPNVPSLRPSSRATCAIGRGPSMTIHRFLPSIRERIFCDVVTCIFPFRCQYTLIGPTIRKSGAHQRRLNGLRARGTPSQQPYGRSLPAGHALALELPRSGRRSTHLPAGLPISLPHNTADRNPLGRSGQLGVRSVSRPER